MNGSSSNHFNAREGKQVMDPSKDDERYVLSILKCEEDAAMHEAPSCFKAEQIMLHRRLVETDEKSARIQEDYERLQ